MMKRISMALALTGLAVAPIAAGAEWAPGITGIEAKSGSVVEVKGNLSAGKPVDLKWAANSSVACFPATQFDHYRGNHVYYGFQLPKESVVTITAVPDDPKTDINLYAYTVGSTDFKRLPPNVPSVTSCEASNGGLGAPANPGGSEKVTLNATTNPYNVILGVAGPKGVVTGGYTLKVELKSKGAGVVSAVLVPVALDAKPNGVVTVKGKLEDGGKIDLGFAAKSAVACWPATENVNFTGNHVVYRTSIPPYSDMIVTATPTDAKTDLSVYAYMVGSGDTKTIPPNVNSAITCEAGYDQKTDNNPGKPETVKVNALKNPYTVYVVVAGANATVAGAYDLKVEIKPKQ